MSGTFSSLSTALSAMRYNQVAMDVASGNVANAGTDGYTRRQVVAQATGSPSVPAMWSRWEGAGDGVQAGPVVRMVDPLLDSRARTEHATGGFLDTRSASLVRFETTLGEPGDNGIAAALASFKSGWHDVANNPTDEAARSQLLARGETLATTVNAQANALANEWSDQRTRLDAMTDQVNSTAQQLAKLNEVLRNADNAGTDANNLLDQRDQLTMRLAELTGAKTTVNADTTVTVTLGGQALVSGNSAATVAVGGATDIAGLGTSPLVVSVGGTAVSLSSGQVGGTLQVLTGDLPGYLGQLDAFAGELATAVNGGQASGKDLDGTTPGAAFFSGTTARSLALSLTDPRGVAAADPAKGAADGSHADALASLDMGEASYRQLITRFGVQVSSAQQVAANQGVMTAQVDASRESVAGVNIDEEMVNLLSAQRGYEGAARVLTTLDSVLDTLINRTAVH